MTREEQIKQYCADQGFPYGACSSISSLKANIATEAIKWADKTMIEKVCEWMKEQTYQEFAGAIFERLIPDELIEDFKKSMEEQPWIRE